MSYQLKVELSPQLEKFRGKIEATVKPFIKILPKKNSKLTWWQSKFGGLPYLPKGYEYPRGANGRPLFLLAQINFYEVPYLASFPQSGILQFYIADNGHYGANFDNSASQNGFRVLYFPEILEREEYLVTDFSFLPKPNSLPLGRTACSITFEGVSAPVGIADYEFEKLLGAAFFEQFGDLEEEIEDEYAEKFAAAGHKMGGYAFFTQNDPRDGIVDGDKYQLLLQVDTDDAVDIMWGDSGVGNFFILEEDLRKLDFSRVLYNWDCY